jgi:hypothetical protein
MPVAVVCIFLLITILAVLVAKKLQTKKIKSFKRSWLWLPIVISILGLIITFVSYGEGIGGGTLSNSTYSLLLYFIYIGSFMTLAAVYWLLLFTQRKTKNITILSVLLILILGLYYVHNY